MKNRKRLEDFLNALITILCNYSAIAFGISIFEKNLGAYIEGLFAILAIYYILILKGNRNR